ncbi:YqiA/YcfP family alpha/beta fold hydrolase [Undibacterium sp.]|jgi:predicted esterase YcpF (UPF0227 family)|uniref:YqiA/YcfP family alpha/beta fold hydrolase n=1 Tax=Undibacterium sp. TaxID=1914977 RepID=UPI002CE0BDD6|nr:YqiA/YcfP family alpha/beta fold hydrolase [Undibacterium sp.]HTD05601.1 YqiA/YcfP family alpha/beta fold hydrolase [Undibacterium sp.]
MILYLHGFRSSPQSFKARMLGQYLQQHGRGAEYLCPQLSASPLLAIRQAEQLLSRYQAKDVALIGSSLGGYYATWLAEKYGCKAVLLNPAVQPPRELEKYVGITTAYHSDEVFEFKQEYVAELQAYGVAAITRPERYFLLAATGDEVLDWREMSAHYASAQQHVIEGSDHGISDFALYLEQVVAFCDGR